MLWAFHSNSSEFSCAVVQSPACGSGLILAGSADFKTELSQSDMFDQVSQVSFRVSLIFKTVMWDQQTDRSIMVVRVKS